MTPTFQLESLYPFPVAGVDEAGCGSWAGPVVAGAAILDAQGLPERLVASLNDSKKLSASKRTLIYHWLKDQEGISCWTAHGLATVEEIDTLNIRQAARLAMERALTNLALKPCFILADGTQMPQVAIEGKSVVKGDQQSYCIAAASIIAKVTRDSLMTKLSQEYPVYGWEKNAGYGTRFHQQALHMYGVTPYHRQSFSPVRSLLEKTS